MTPLHPFYKRAPFFLTLTIASLALVSVPSQAAKKSSEALEAYRAELGEIASMAETQSKACDQKLNDVRSQVPPAERESGNYTEAALKKVFPLLKQFAGFSPELSSQIAALTRKATPKGLSEDDYKRWEHAEQALLGCFPGSAPNFARRMAESANRAAQADLNAYLFNESVEVLRNGLKSPLPFMVAVFQTHVAEELTTLTPNSAVNLKQVERFNKRLRKWRGTLNKNLTRALSAEDYSRAVRVKLDSLHTSDSLRRELVAELASMSWKKEKPVSEKPAPDTAPTPIPTPSVSPTPSAP